MSEQSGETARTEKARTIRPRPGDLEAATRPHQAVPSGELTGRNDVEVCDLCGLTVLNRPMHMSPTAQWADPDVSSTPGQLTPTCDGPGLHEGRPELVGDRVLCPACAEVA